MTDDVIDEESTSHVVHFDVEGKFIADLARTRVSEGAWEHGLKILVDSFQGMSHDQAISILKGESDLAGWASDEHGVHIVETGPDCDEAVKMRERLDWLYGSVFRHAGKYWKPYARITGWGPTDYDFSRKFRGTSHVLDTTVRSNSSRYRPELVSRSLYYANDPHRDLLLVVQLNSVLIAEILCERTEMPPLWFKVPGTNIGEHIAERIKQRKLRVDEDGYSYREGVRSPVTQSPVEEALTPAEIAEEKGIVEAVAAPEPVAAPAAPEPDQPEAPRVSVQEALARVKAFKQANALVKEFTKKIAQADTPEALSEVSRRFDREMDAIDRELKGGLDELNDTRYRLLDEAQADRLKLLGERVREQAKAQGGFFKLKLKDKDGKPYAKQRSVEVPLHPFIIWALRGFNYEAFGKERPAWDLVCGTGMKMVMDDPYHSDWMLGAGLRLDMTYRDEDETGEPTVEALVRTASFEERARICESWAGAQFAILARGSKQHSYYGGEVVHAKPNQPVPAGSIAIAATAGPEYQLAMESANAPGEYGRPGLLICETGGKLAHLATVGRELGCTVLMVPNALERYREGRTVSIHMDKGTIELFL